MGPVYLKGMGVPGTNPSSVRALATDADAATPLPSSPVTGSLNVGEFDLYRVDLKEGQRLVLQLTLGAGASGIFDLYLFPPGLWMFADAVAVAHATEWGYPRTITYDVPLALAGPYFVEVNAFTGSGQYRLTWRVCEPAENLRRDVDAATTITVGAVVPFRIENDWGSNSVFRVALPSNRRVEISLSGPYDADFDLYLYSPGTTTILSKSVVPLQFDNTPRSNERIVFDVPPGATGIYYVEILRFNGSGPGFLYVDSNPIPSAPLARRVWGDNRFVTAAEMSRRAYPAGSATAVLVSGRAFPDGLAAASLAGALEAPILLTEPGILPPATRDELRRLGVRKVFIVGGSGAVSNVVRDAVEQHVPDVETERISGVDRYGTAAEVADKVRQVTGVRPPFVFLASGENFPDALSLSPLAFTSRSPIVLTRSGTLPTASTQIISGLRPPGGTLDLYVAGGTGVVSNAVAGRAHILAGGSLARFGGANRYDTSLMIAEHAVVHGWAQARTLAIASGATFPDALAGASIAGRHAAPLLLTTPTALSDQVMDYLKSKDFLIQECIVFGGTGAISESTWRTLNNGLPTTPLP